MYKTCLLLIGLVLAPTSSAQSQEWFRGNTHAHSNRSDGDSSPEVVVKWYHDHNYNFLVLSDHNTLVDPNQVELPQDKREDFVLIPGEEITGNKIIHTNAFNITTLVPWDYDHKEKSAIIQNHVNGTIEAGGYPILNHPNFHYAVSAQDMLPVKDLRLFEVYNGHPSTNNFGDSTHPSTEAIWDELLTNGMVIYGVASDDTHHLQSFSPSMANPGRGWLMVNASQLAPNEIVTALVNGDFYASSGVFLSRCDKDSLSYSVEADTARTRQELSSLPSVLGRPVSEGTAGYKLEFVGPYGEVLAGVSGTEGTYTVRNSDAYVRARVTLTVQADDDTYEEYYAWGQPVFNEGLLALRSSAVGTATPGALLAGRSASLEVSVVLDDSGETGWPFQQLILDLSSYAGPSEVSLRDTGAGRYVGSATVIPPRNGSYRLAVMMVTPDQERLPLLRVPLAVYPDGDLTIYDDAAGENWTVTTMKGEPDLMSTAFVHTGSFSQAILLTEQTMVTYRSTDPEGVGLFGYTHLEFWVNGGEASGQDPMIAGKKLSQRGIVPEPNTWKQVTVPIAELADPLTLLYFGGWSEYTFYMDDMKLVAEELPTAVEGASEPSAVPAGYGLSQNVPNPFNAVTTITYSVPTTSHVTLTVYSIAGQRLATLVSEEEPAGYHQATWDARGFATGVYIASVKAGDFSAAKKMVLLK